MNHQTSRGFDRVRPFEHLNLKRNPFGSLDWDEWGALAIIDLPDIETGQVWQIIGDSGRGKTTHLLGLGHRYENAVYEYVAPERPRVRSKPKHVKMLLLDEAQRLRPRALRKVFDGFETLVIGTHDDLAAHCIRRKIETLELEGLTVEKLAEVVNSRIESVRLGEGPLPKIERECLLRLIERHDDDLRAIGFDLYELFQNMEEIDHVKV